MVFRLTRARLRAEWLLLLFALVLLIAYISFCASGIRTLAVSETQKFGHVTYFFNGNKSGKIDEKLEEALLANAVRPASAKTAEVSL